MDSNKITHTFLCPVLEPSRLRHFPLKISTLCVEKIYIRMCVWGLYIYIFHLHVFFFFPFHLFFSPCFRNWTRSAVISSENAASSGILKQEQKQKCLESLEKAPDLLRAILEFLLAQSMDQ